VGGVAGSCSNGSPFEIDASIAWKSMAADDRACAIVVPVMSGASTLAARSDASRSAAVNAGGDSTLQPRHPHARHLDGHPPVTAFLHCLTTT
jgi:hypothetical protein